MNIEEAKKKLEDKIIFEDGVLGIGVKIHGERKVIEVALRDSVALNRYRALFSDGFWQGFQVQLIIREQTAAQ